MAKTRFNSVKKNDNEMFINLVVCLDFLLVDYLELNRNLSQRKFEQSDGPL